MSKNFVTPEIASLGPLLTKEGKNLNRFEEILSGIVPNSEEVEQLLNLFSDDREFQDEMWSLLHCIESASLDQFIDCVIRAIKILNLQAPYWSGIIAVRILNSPNALQQFRHQLGFAARIDKVAWKSTLDEIVRYDESYSEVVLDINTTLDAS